MQKKSFIFLLFISFIGITYAQTKVNEKAKLLAIPTLCSIVPNAEGIWGHIPNETPHFDEFANQMNALRTMECEIKLSKITNLVDVTMSKKFKDDETYKKLIEPEVSRYREYTYQGDLIAEIKIDANGVYISHEMFMLMHPGLKNLTEAIPFNMFNFQGLIENSEAKETTVKVTLRVSLEEQLLVAP